MSLVYGLKSLLLQTKYNVYGIEQINQYVSELSNWIDLVLETENCFICFKDIWSHNHLTSNLLNQYLHKSEYINSNQYVGKKIIFILLIKNSHFNYSNQVLNQKNIHIIKKFNQANLFKEIGHFLYSNEIYFFESDGCAIMLE